VDAVKEESGTGVSPGEKEKSHIFPKNLLFWQFKNQKQISE
jgi:hypothetical protein